MTEEIIIDGVDVSGCVKQGETVAGITCGNGERIRLANEIITKHKLCKDNPNCYYKQLQREKQNSQESRDISIKEFNRAEELNTLLKRKEQECEELKHKVELMMDCASCKVDEYKQTLTEIKEIAKNMNNECFYSDFDCKGCDMKNGCTYFNKKQILQKISECEVKHG